MKLTLLQRRIQAWYLCGGFVGLAVNLLLASTSLGQFADTRIAFMSTRSERNGEIFLMNPDGKRVRRLTKHPQYDAAPAWSPDGQKITFMSFRDEHRIQVGGIILGDIYVMNADGTNPINLTQSIERPESVSSWSPDGKQIAFRSAEYFRWDDLFHSDIWVMEADGANPINLTNHHAQDSAPDWSPDGMQIAFHSDRNRDWEFEIDAMNWEVYVMNADGTNFINLTNHLAGDGSPDWSPDRRQIAFHSERDRKDDNDKNVEIYVMNFDGTNPINLTNHPAIDRGASWEPAPTLSVASNGRLATLWGKVKRTNTYRVR